MLCENYCIIVVLRFVIIGLGLLSCGYYRFRIEFFNDGKVVIMVCCFGSDICDGMLCICDVVRLINLVRVSIRF